MVPKLLSQLNFSEEQNKRIQERTCILIEKVRAGAQSQNIIDQMMRQFPLSTHEGVLLMCLAEALLRIPDRSTRNALLRDKLSQADFKKYLNNPSSWIMKLATRGFSLGVALLKENESSPFKRALGKTSLPVMEKVADQAMRLLAGKFVLGSCLYRKRCSSLL